MTMGLSGFPLCSIPPEPRNPGLCAKLIFRTNIDLRMIDWAEKRLFKKIIFLRPKKTGLPPQSVHVCITPMLKLSITYIFCAKRCHGSEIHPG